MKRPFLTAEWRYLVMLNFRVDPGLLSRYVPEGTELDTWNGEHWLSLVGFRFLRTRVFGVPIPGHRHFPEVNLRFYVRPLVDSRRAVVFLREIVPRSAIAVTARAIYNEPYVARRMRVDAPMVKVDHPGTVSYRWYHRDRWNEIGATATGDAAPIAAGSVEEFLAEHYWGYTSQRDGSTIEYRVTHPRWHIWPVRDVIFDVDTIAEYGDAFGEVLSRPPDVTLLAEGSTVQVGWPKRLHLG